jgi:hypothetical protein
VNIAARRPLRVTLGAVLAMASSPLSLEDQDCI